MKNKEKYDLTKLSVVPKYMVNGCGKRLTERFTFDVLIDNEVVASVKARETILKYLLEWLEKEADPPGKG